MMFFCDVLKKMKGTSFGDSYFLVVCSTLDFTKRGTMVIFFNKQRDTKFYYYISFVHTGTYSPVEAFSTVNKRRSTQILYQVYYYLQNFETVDNGPKLFSTSGRSQCTLEISPSFKSENHERKYPHSVYSKSHPLKSSLK